MKDGWIIVLLPLISVIAISLAVHEHAVRKGQFRPAAAAKAASQDAR
jgi:hypothetical protein